MKKLIVGMLALASFIFSANAQEKRKMNHHKHHNGSGTMMKGLNLSSAQKEQMKAAAERTNSELAELYKNEDITVREFRSRRAAILKSRKEQIDKVLTPEQKNQVAQNKLDRKAKQDQFRAKRLDKMKSALTLTDDQVNKINANREAGQARAKAIRESGQLSETEKKEQLIALKKEERNSFKQVLTEEQINKMEEMKKDRADKRGRK